MSYTANHSINSGLKPSYSGQLDPYSSPQKGLIKTPYFRSSQGLEHQSSMLGALSGVPFVGKVASGYQKAVNAQIDRQFQEYMARLGFDFSNEQREKQNLYNYWVASEFMDKQNQWNSYANQVAEMRRAGLNPAGIFGEGQLTGNNSSQSAPTAGASGGSATGIGYQSQTAVGDMSEMADFASAIKSISDAKLSDQQRADLLATATDRYKEIKENSDKATYERQLAGMNAWILSEYGSKMKEAELKHMDALTQNLLAAAGLAIAQTGTEQEKQKKAMHEAWQAYMDWLERNHMYDAKLKLNYWYKSVENDLVQQAADITKTQKEGDAVERTSVAQAGYYAEQANDLRKTRQARIDNMRADTRQKNALAAINEYELDTRPSKIVASWHNFVNMCVETVSTVSSSKYLQQQLDLIGQEIERAKKNNDYYLVGMLMDNAKDFAIALGSFAIAAKTGKEMIGTKTRPIGFNK